MKSSQKKAQDAYERILAKREQLERNFYGEKKSSPPPYCASTPNKSSQTLYLYRGMIVCHRNHHDLASCTAYVFNKNDKQVPLNVDYCPVCQKYLLDYNLFVEDRKKYGILIGDFQLLSSKSNNWNNEQNWAEESPLHLSGYNVGQEDGFPDAIRQYTLARIIHNGFMSKSEVIRYLSHFIRLRGTQETQVIPVRKWKRDLDFVRNYQIETQPATFLTEVKLYKHPPLSNYKKKK